LLRDLLEQVDEGPVRRARLGVEAGNLLRKSVLSNVVDSSIFPVR
jgi:hypothetical protein